MQMQLRTQRTSLIYAPFGGDANAMGTLHVRDHVAIIKWSERSVNKMLHATQHEMWDECNRLTRRLSFRWFSIVERVHAATTGQKKTKKSKVLHSNSHNFRWLRPQHRPLFSCIYWVRCSATDSGWLTRNSVARAAHTKRSTVRTRYYRKLCCYTTLYTHSTMWR